MKRAKQINELNQKELSLGYTNTASSWHHQEKNKTAYIYIGGLDFRLTEGDLLSVFSQYGEIVDIDLVREEQELTSKGFCFIAYEDIRSTVLAIDNLNGIELGGRIICVDHAPNYYKKVVEDPSIEDQQSSKNSGRGGSRFKNNYQQQEKNENIPKYETMEKNGTIYKKVTKGNDFEWVIHHDAMKKRDPNWLHKYLMTTMYEEPSSNRHDSSDEEEEEEETSLAKSNEKSLKASNIIGSSGEEPKKKLSKEEKKRKKEEKKERKELKKLKKMEEKMFGGLDTDV